MSTPPPALEMFQSWSLSPCSSSSSICQWALDDVHILYHVLNFFMAWHYAKDENSLVFFCFLNQQCLQLTTQAGSVEANRFDKAVPINFLIDISCSLWLAGCNDLILKCKAEQVVKGVVWEDTIVLIRIEVNEDGGSALLTKLLVLPFFIYFFSCYNAKSNT